MISTLDIADEVQTQTVSQEACKSYRHMKVYIAVCICVVTVDIQQDYSPNAFLKFLLKFKAKQWQYDFDV